MKTPDEIKKGLEACSADECHGYHVGCPYYNFSARCMQDMAADALAYIQQLEAKVPQWISVDDRLPQDFVSVLAHMTDAGEFPDVREAYAVCGMFFFPALHEHHPVDYWMEMPELQKEE